MGRAPTRSTESTGWGALRIGRSPGTDRGELRGDRGGDGRGGRRAALAPQGVAKPDHGDAEGNGEEPFVLRQYGGPDGCHGSDSKESRRPPGEDVGPEHCD